MNLDKFCAFFELPDNIRFRLAGDWESLLSLWNGEVPPFIDAAFFKKYYPHCFMPFSLEELMPRVEKVIQIVQQNPEAAFLAALISAHYFELKSSAAIDFLPDVIPHFGEEYSGMFAMMISMGSCPFIEKSYAEIGLPEHYAADVFQWFGGTMHAYAQAHNGIPGRPFQFFWIKNYVEKKLFRIGRLEYLLHPYPDWMPLVFLNKKGETAVIAPQNWLFRPDGYRTNDPDQAVFNTQIEEDELRISGTPIAPDGSVDFSKTLALDKKLWSPAAAPWDLCPSLHIPAGIPLKFDEVKDSLIQAVEFFQIYFKRHVQIFVCCSWLLNPAWEDLLPNSNIARFRREAFAAPGPDWGPRVGMNYIFGRRDIDPDQMNITNSLQRAFLKAWQLKRIGTGIIFFLTKDLQRIGGEFYRS